MGRDDQIAANGRYYDGVAAHYDDTRRAADFIWRRVARVLPDPAAGPVLDVGCGTGNYALAMAESGRRVVGLDRSAGMLRRALHKTRAARDAAAAAHYALADAAAFPFPDASFAAVVHILSMHHFDEPEASVCEAYRVLRLGGRACWFTFDADQVRASWFAEYFRDAADTEAGLRAVQPGWLENACDAAGFTEVLTERVREAEYDEGCLNSLKHHPAKALDPAARANISFFRRMTAPAVETGLARLRVDLTSGAWADVVERARAQNEIFGDYLFVYATKELPKVP